MTDLNFQAIIRSVYDQDNNALQTTATLGSSTVFIGTPTLNAVVNTSAATDPKIFIGLTTAVIGSVPTIFAVVNTSAAGQSSVVVDRGHNFIGLVTVVQSDSSRSIVGNVTIDSGTVSLSAGTNQIGSVTIPHVVSTTLSGNITISSGSVAVTSLSALTVGSATIGIVRQADSARTITGNLTLSDARAFIGLVTARAVGLTTVVQTGNTTVIQASSARTITGNITLSDAKTFIGLVTAQSLNAGTTKTLVQLPIGLGNNSLSTIAVPTNANRIKATNIVLNSNITTTVAIRSGVTYLTGNASLGITIFPGGGFVNPGSPDSPSWIGLPSGSLNIEKRDSGGTVSRVSGQLIYFEE